MTLELSLMLFAIFLVAGAVKGLAGIGLPTVAISLMSQIIEPRLAISLALAPLLFTNFWQIIRMGQIWETLKRYWICAVVLGTGLFLTAQFAQTISTRNLILILGVVVAAFSLTSLFFHPPFLPDRYAAIGQVSVGVIGGVLGGFTAIWGPPILIYLLARRIEKDEFIRAVGVLLVFGSVPLIISHWYAGRFVSGTFAASMLLTLPSVLGFAFGEYFRQFLDQQRFQKMVLLAFFILGLNLIRRGLA